MSSSKMDPPARDVTYRAWPWCAWAIARTTDRPRPEPPNLRERDTSARVKGSNACRAKRDVGRLDVHVQPTDVLQRDDVQVVDETGQAFDLIQQAAEQRLVPLEHLVPQALQPAPEDRERGAHGASIQDGHRRDRACALNPKKLQLVDNG
ncbi:hypothetical protein WI42_00125 [Burkholderia ubonensis]|nr:hypothetical protein WI43_16305 [Burkholderia ubonensis]KVA25544.1 hypothetical protein WI42_00125 [Burkholderia ubonensis]KVA38551.1 hypothetical protein WI46_00685 [Burkholderia ubonensis]